MKKTAIALVIAGLTAASLAQAAPQENTFYAGARVGWASYHDGVDAFHNFDEFGVKKNSVTYGVFGGYQIFNRDNFGLAVELGYDDYGRLRLREPDAKTGKFTNHGVNLSLKPSYEILDGLDIYARIGAALIRTDHKDYYSDEAGHSLKVSPTFAAGLEYAILPELALRLEYQWIENVGRDNKWSGYEDTDFTPDIGSVTLGLSYRFGQGVAVPVAEPIATKTFSLSSDVLFNSGKYNLKPAATETLDGIYNEIAQVNNAKVDVAGYADRMGKEDYNLKLSQHRAETVANYLVGKGVAANAITATGYGEANPVTGNSCDHVKGRKALIACLAPDRRVTIQLNGTK
ncbi:porin OmpA [Pasteurellaceae bacterium LIM206]|nr:porin OmpA [Pasteurellaceae bacterium LIM206]